MTKAVGNVASIKQLNLRGPKANALSHSIGSGANKFRPTIYSMLKTETVI
jgi:hypothetical protein